MSFLFFSTFPYCIKEKSVETLAIRTIAIKRKTSQVSSPTASPELATLLGKYLKSGVTLGLDHLYLLSLFDLYALHFGSLFGLESSTRIWETL